MTGVRRSADRRRRRKRSGRYYSLDELLSRQPKSLRKDPQYRELCSHFLSSDVLPRLRINSRCFRLLDKAVIAPENLNNFYHTYRLPRDPFFPLFLRIKRSYITMRQQQLEAREAYIFERMKALPPEKLRFIRFLAEWEQSLNRSSDFPYWMNQLYPGSKKRMREYELYGVLEWQQFFYSYLCGLAAQYRLQASPLAEKMTACSMLGLIPSADPLIWPGRTEILRAYRARCRRFHPDRGGEHSLFIQLQKAKEVLCET